MMVSHFSRSKAARWAAALLFSALALGWFANQAGPRDGEVDIRVLSPDGEVRIDGRLYPTPTDPDDPIVARLTAGSHQLTMHRVGRLVYEESFEVLPGEQKVLAAFDRTQPHGSSSEQ